MEPFRVGQAAELLGVSADTVRRWIDAGRLPATKQGHQRLIDPRDLAAFAEAVSRSTSRHDPTSARNRLVGLVTRVTKDTVMAQVDLACGPYRLVSLISREAADELGFEPGSLVVATIKATNVVLQLPA